MKVFEKCKKIFATCLLLTTTSIIFSGNTIAFEKDILKTTIKDKIADDIVNNDTEDIKQVHLSSYTYVPELVGNNLASRERFSLADELNLRIENQGVTNFCWAFSLLKSLETNIALENGEQNIKDFSERHMAYATSKTFIDGINIKGFNSEVSEGGLLVEGLAYLTNGQGAVKEEDMPFENNENLISLSSIDKPVDTIVNDYYIFPAIYKEYSLDEKGNTISVKYLNEEDIEYSASEIKSIRQAIKNHIVTEGAISSMTAGTLTRFYNGSSILNSTSYNCNDSSITRDHAITIIGWDDNYSRDNFAEGHKPSTDGAYIVLNSYGPNAFAGGILYISYEDYFIEMESYGIQSTSSVDYDKIYQTDFYGGIYQIGIDTSNVGYYGAIFGRNSNKKEAIDSIGVTLSAYAKIEIYINPNGSNMNQSSLIKVGESNGELNPGYHRIYFNPVKLTNSEFAIVIKQTSSSGTFYFEIETDVEDTPYEFVTSDNNSYLSFDGSEWINLSELNVSGLNMQKTDVCIKAFTDEIEETTSGVSSEIYKIEDKYIYNIQYNTSIESFKNNIKTDSNIVDFTIDGEIVQDGIVKTGMKIKFSDGSEYTIIVRGDINKDGNLTLTDLSKLILHYNEMRGFELSGDALKGADMNLDGRVSLIDVSQMLILYNSI